MYVIYIHLLNRQIGLVVGCIDTTITSTQSFDTWVVWRRYCQNDVMMLTRRIYGHQDVYTIEEDEHIAMFYIDGARARIIICLQTTLRLKLQQLVAIMLDTCSTKATLEVSNLETAVWCAPLKWVHKLHFVWPRYSFSKSLRSH